MRSYKCGLGGRFGWMSHTKIGLSPRRLLFMSRVKFVKSTLLTWISYTTN